MLIMQFLTGMTTSSMFTVRMATSSSVEIYTDYLQMCGTLLTDFNATKSATAQASYNLVRCLGAGAGIAALQPVVEATNIGYGFAVYAIIMLLAIPLTWLLRRRGPAWRLIRN